MKKSLYRLILMMSVGMLAAGCEDENIPEALDVQKPYTYSDKYYENLRAYKASDHAVAFGWFADYKNHSLGTRFAGVPDSMDIVSLWGGIPSDKEEGNQTHYNPLAYEEMRFMQKVKGTRLVIPTIIRIRNFVDVLGLDPASPIDPEGVWAQKFGDYLLAPMWENDLDGLDLDFEPEGDPLDGTHLVTLVEYLAKHIGPKSPNPDKLLCIDYYGNVPDSRTEPYVNYFIRQAYGASSATTLNGHVRPWMPEEKLVVTENIGDYWANGGVNFTEADGNTLNPDGTRMTSLVGMARWNPVQGRKGGFGAFFFQRDYNSNPPYKHLRAAIQAQNPAVK